MLENKVYYLYIKYSMWNGIIAGSDGKQIRLIDIAELRQFATHRSRVFHYLDTVGERFMAGYLIPAEFANKVILQQLKQELAEFYRMVNEFVASYKDNLAACAELHGPRGRQNIALAPTEKEVADKFSIDYMVFKLCEADVDDGTFKSAGGWFNFEATANIARERIIERCYAVLGRLSGLKRATRNTAESLLSFASYINYRACFDARVAPFADKLREMVMEAVRLYNLQPMIIEAKQIIKDLKTILETDVSDE